MKSLVIIFVVLIVGIIFIAVWDFPSSTTIDNTNYNEIAWRIPGDDEIKKVDRSFLLSGELQCSTYFIKKFSGEKYLIACDQGDEVWAYYTVYTSQNKVYKTSGDLVASFIPPRVKRKQSQDNIVKHASETPLKAKPVTVEPAIEAK